MSQLMTIDFAATKLKISVSTPSVIIYDVGVLSNVIFKSGGTVTGSTRLLKKAAISLFRHKTLMELLHFVFFNIF